MLKKMMYVVAGWAFTVIGPSWTSMQHHRLVGYCEMDMDPTEEKLSGVEDMLRDF